ncbi:uteroglobin [Cynocephalus volans]|uniref:uteroglobin n=1 Tax=Cynocephalus volans TaxID=110931 RepID=UPI002FC90CA6
MKLTVTLTLVMLALCCSPASADVCPAFLQVIETIFLGTLSTYQAALQPFSPDQDMQDAGIQLKKLVDTLPQQAKDSILKLMEKIVRSPQCTQELGIQSPSDLEAEDSQTLKALPQPLAS